MKYLYAPCYRPPGYGTVPPGYSIEERGPELALPLRPDLPMGKHRFGVINYVRRLTDEEVADFQLQPLGAINK